MKLYAVVWRQLLKRSAEGVFRQYRKQDQYWQGVDWLTAEHHVALRRHEEAEAMLGPCLLVEIEYEGE